MSTNRIIGIVLLIIGMAVLIMGMNSRGSAADQVTNTFTGHYTDHTTWYIIGGGAAAAMGALMAVFGGSGKAA